MGIMSILGSKAMSNSTVTPTLNEVFLIVFSGESNSGGYANNADATTYEKSARSSVQKLDEYTLLFDDLHVTENNLQDHYGFTDNSSHGWEAGLANCVEDNVFVGKSEVYLVKTGQGASTISQWNVGGTYLNKLTERYEASVDILTSEGKTPKPIIWYTQGINDAIAGTNEVTWKANTITHIGELREVMGADTPFLFVEIMAGSSGASYNDSITAICAEVDNCYLISCLDAGLRDTNHWNYAGMKLIAERLCEKTEELLNV
jgi:hypothetical protein